MKLTRRFFISDDLEDLEALEGELESAGITTPQIHVLTLDDDTAGRHRNLHTVTSLMRRDLVHSALLGLGIGAVAAILVLLVAAVTGWADTAAGWTPFVFLAIVLFGFFVWEGGLLGIETPNVHFRRFEEALQAGRHVLFVDIAPEQAPIVESYLQRHPRLEPAGTGRAAPHWLVRWQHRIRHFFVEVFP